MKAAVMREINAPLVIEDVTIEKPQAGEVLVRTAASGICHSDLHVIEGGIPLPPPCILGHEPAGVVEEVGEGVTGFAPGDRSAKSLTVALRRPAEVGLYFRIPIVGFPLISYGELITVCRPV